MITWHLLVPFFLAWTQITMWSHLLLPWRTSFSISYNVDLSATKSLSTWLSEKLLCLHFWNTGLLDIGFWLTGFLFFFFLSAPYKCYPIAFWPSSFVLKSLLPKLKELPLSVTSFFSWCFQYLSLTSIIFTMIYLFVDLFVFTANWILKKFLDM